jgi:hypothetical protein
MSSNERLVRLPDSDAFQLAPAVAPDADFDARWNAWVARGQVHEQRVRRKLDLLAGVLAIGAAIVYAVGIL